MLVATGRGGVPIRGAFVQLPSKDADGKRLGPLAALTGDQSTLDAYLLIHALASASTPYSTTFPGVTWAHVSGMTTYASQASARQRWSKSVQRLVKLGLIARELDGKQARYTLLHESGNGEPYTRPRSITDGGWVTIPHLYWLDGYDQDLSFPEKLMLLVALDQKPAFELPAARTKEWYGISESTAKRGLSGLVARGILAATKHSEVDPKSPTMYRTVNVYATQGPWTHAARKSAMTLERRKSRASFAAPRKTAGT